MGSLGSDFVYEDYGNVEAPTCSCNGNNNEMMHNRNTGILKCPVCGYEIDWDEWMDEHYDEFMEDEMNSSYDEDEMPECCVSCGCSAYPKCMTSCKFFDD